jgi:hypothetical protein
MTSFLIFWNVWAHMFRLLPNGDPYVAAFVLVVLVVIILKTLRSAAKFMLY